ncbi:hypothetical protein [Acetivibrio cellulolyticus]|uniref:hypothetical protein n=1 Tax=Acetivibrio cellulolyticus TaxID=35830 RepID=UPI0001E2BE22|nr:hypothetical protein [Acetivibrio cellulolyticus]
MCSLIKELENNCNNLNKFASFIKGASKDYEDSEKIVNVLLNSIENKTKTISREISDFWDVGKSLFEDQAVDRVKEYAKKLIDWGANFDILKNVDETVDYLTNMVDTKMEEMFKYLNEKADECFDGFEDLTDINEKNMVYRFIKDRIQRNIGILEGGVDEVVDMVVGILALAAKFNPNLLSLRIGNGIKDIIINPDKYITKAIELKNTMEYLVKNRGEVLELIIEEVDNYSKELEDDPYKRGQVTGHIALFIASLFIGGGEAKVASKASKAEDALTGLGKIERLLTKIKLRKLTAGKSPKEIAEIMECFGKYGDDALKAIKKGIDPEHIRELEELGIKPSDYKKLGIVSREIADMAAETKIANELSTGVLNKAKYVEPEITKAMKSLEIDGAHLEGLDYRQKSNESLCRKILSDSHAKGITLEEAASGIGDSLRYTLVADESNYTRLVEQSLKQLEEQGYKINKVKNFWGEEIYQGINVSLTTPDGVKMELQFHTSASYYTKEVLNHKYYEIARSETASIEEITEANKIMIENQSKVTMPDGVKDISGLKGD